MPKLLMISGKGAIRLGDKGAFYNTLEEFHHHWDRIDIIAPRGGQKETLTYFGNVFVHSSPWPLIFQPWFILQKGRELYRQHRFDLVTVHDYAPFYNGIGAKFLYRALKVPYVLELMHIPGYPQAGSIKEFMARTLTRWLIAWDSGTARAVRIINQHEVPRFLIHAGVPEKKLVYIPAMYIEGEIFHPHDVEKKYDLVFVGRLEKNKGIHLFLDAIRKLKIPSLIVGDGSLRREIKEAIEKEHLPVTLHGWARDAHEVAHLMNQSKVLVMPSYNEGGPRVVVEAMACGVPVLATPVGMVPDIVHDQKSGRIIAWDGNDIAAKSRNVLDDQAAYGAYRQAGLVIAHQFERKTAIKYYADSLKKYIA